MISNYINCDYCLHKKMMGVTVERLRGELNVYKNANSKYQKIIKDLTKKVNELELELNEYKFSTRSLDDDK